MSRDDSELRAAGYFAIIPEWVLCHPELSDRAVRMYGVLRRHADKDTREAIPSRRALAKALSCSRDSVDRASRELRAVGAVEVVRRWDEAGDPTSNLYVVHHDQGAAPVQQGGRTLAETPTRSPAATGSRTGAAHNQSHLEPESFEPEVPCLTQGCNRELGHSGAHQNPWWDAIVEALGHEPNPRQKSRFGELARRVRDRGDPPGKILDAARWIAREWGPSKLTLNSLSEHYERATSDLAELTAGDADRARRLEDDERSRREILDARRRAG